MCVLMAVLLQVFLDDTEHLNPFQAGFRMETTLVIDLSRAQDGVGGSVSLSVLLDLSAAFQYHQQSYPSGVPVWVVSEQGRSQLALLLPLWQVPEGAAPLDIRPMGYPRGQYGLPCCLAST